MKKGRMQIIEELSSFYKANQINPDNFNCHKCDSLKKNLSDYVGGQECHVGTHIDEAPLLLLVVALDCGGGGRYDIATRTKCIETDPIKYPHMRNTVPVVADLLGFSGENQADCRAYYCTSNACKCTWNRDKMDQMSYEYYDNCAFYKLKEIEIINPDVIYFQGKNALRGKDVVFENIEGRTDDIFQHLKWLVVEGKKFYAVQCVHPSYRNQNVVKDFNTNWMPKINEYLKEHLQK